MKDGQIPNPNVVRVAPGTGYHCVEGNRRASRNGRVSDLPPEIPHATIRNFLIAVRLTCARAACSDEAEWGDTVLLAHECDVEDFCKPEQSEPSKPKESGKE